MEFHDYLAFLEQLCQELDALSGVEQQKISAVRSGDLGALDACMKQEQAAALGPGAGARLPGGPAPALSAAGAGTDRRHQPAGTAQLSGAFQRPADRPHSDGVPPAPH